jgi:hypothetical protein
MLLPYASQSLRMPDELWEKVQPFLPSDKPHPLGFIALVLTIGKP